MKKYLVIGISIGIYILGYLICISFFMQDRLLYSYTADWVTRHFFMFTWIVSIILALNKKYITSLSTTVGCFLGIIIGDILGNYIITIRSSNIEKLIMRGGSISAEKIHLANVHYGVLIWICTIFTIGLIGLFWDRKLK